MANNNLTLIDWAKRLDPDGKVPEIAEMLWQSLAMVEDAIFVEANGGLTHTFLQRTGLPDVFFRMIGQGIPASKSTTTAISESFSNIEGRSTIDVELAMLNGNDKEFMLSEEEPFVEAISQKMGNTLLYGNPTADPNQFAGFAPRYSSSTAKNGQNIIKAGGIGTVNTSIWFVNWGTNSCHCAFPKGTKAGLTHEDQGKLTLPQPNGTLMDSWVSKYNWKNGLVLKDWRHVVRICNIDTNDLIGQSATQAGNAATNILYLMIRAKDRPPFNTAGRGVFYVNRTIATALGIMALNKSNTALGFTEAVNQFGQKIQQLTFMGYPVRIMDNILNTESPVV